MSPKFWQVSAGVTKAVGRWRQVSAKIIAGDRLKYILSAALCSRYPSSLTSKRKPQSNRVHKALEVEHRSSQTPPTPQMLYWGGSGTTPQTVSREGYVQYSVAETHPNVPRGMPTGVVCSTEFLTHEWKTLVPSLERHYFLWTARFMCCSAPRGLFAASLSVKMRTNR